MAGELATTRDLNCQAYLQNLCITLKWQPALTLTTILSRTILFTDLPNEIPEQNFTTYIHTYIDTHIYIRWQRTLHKSILKVNMSMSVVLVKSNYKGATCFSSRSKETITTKKG